MSQSAWWLSVLALCGACSKTSEPVAPPGPTAGIRGTVMVSSAGAAAISGRPALAGASAGSASAGTPGLDSDAGALDQDAAVGLPTDASVPTQSPVRGTGPGDWVAGDYPKDLAAQTYLELEDVPGQAGHTRQYKVHVPPSYVPTTPMPVVFCIHGLGQNAVMFCVDGAGMPTKADAAGFILVMPNGYQNSWNAGTCCGAAVDAKLDDVALMRAIFKEVAIHLNIDQARVYATGLSNGGYMSYRLACEASDLFVAVAPGAGAIGMNDIGGGAAIAGDFAACAPTQKSLRARPARHR